MNISYNEFHVGRKIRDQCDFGGALYASTGNVILANLKSVRAFAEKLNALFDRRGQHEKRVSAGSLNAMGLLDEVFHYVCMLYRRDKKEDAFSGALSALDSQFGKEAVDRMLLDFSAEFPPTAVYRGELTAEEYLSQSAVDTGTGKTRTNREQTLEELILLRLANENPAFRPFSVLFDDEALQKSPLYEKAWAAVQKYFGAQPAFGPFRHDLITMLREPVAFSPDSLKGQLDYVRQYWADLLGDWLRRLLEGLDTLSEEEKMFWHPTNGGDVEMEPYNYDGLMKEYERFSPDRDWMPRVILMAKTVLVWLDQLTKKYGRPITRLDQIPDEELDILRDEGFTGLWLIGLWERSNASKRIKQICGNPEAAASAYSLYDYNIAWNIGGWDALANLRTRLWQRGIRLASDMVPNHTGMDSDWVINRPDLFIQRRDCPFPSYSFNGENLSKDPRVGVYLEDHYYSKSDCSVVFKRVDNQTGDTRYIYHGNDGTGMPWNDTAQIDFLNPAAREAVMQEILHVARNFPIIRFDAAMVLAKKHIRRLWYPEPGHGGDIATRSETGLSNKQFNDAIPNEFWREVVDRVAKEVPDTLLLAEAFWMMEGYFVRTLGMHRVYNSAFMNMLKKEENQKYRDTVKNTIKFDPQILKRYVNFMNNPDEETAEAQFGKGDKYFGVCTLMVTMPGLPMFGHGQIEGYTEKYGMEFTKAYRDEKPDQGLVDRHWHDIFPLMKKRYIFADVDNFLFYDVWDNGGVNENIFAYSNSFGGEYAVVFYNNKYERAQGWIKQSCDYAVKTGGDTIEMRSRSISEGLNLTAEDDKFCLFREHRTGMWFVRRSRDICEHGMFVALNGFEYQVLTDIHQVADMPDHRYRILCDTLQGRGCYDLEVEWQEICYRELYRSLSAFAQETLYDIHILFQPDAAEAQTAAQLKKRAAAMLVSCKKAALQFYETADRFADGDAKLPKPEKRYAAFKAAAETLLADRLGRAKSAVKNAREKDCHAYEILAAYAMVRCEADTGLAERWALARKLGEYMQGAGMSGADFRTKLSRVFALAPVSDPDAIEKDAKKASFEIVRLMTSGGKAAMLSGANTFDNTAWFNKELSDESLAYAAAVASVRADAGQQKAVADAFKAILAAKEKAGYKCEEFIRPFVPKTAAKAKKGAAKAKGEPAKKGAEKGAKAKGSPAAAGVPAKKAGAARKGGKKK